jgi:pimeloyl-ACP methyl ester carboxylesterase
MERSKRRFVMATATVNGVCLWYELVGAGDVVVHIHGAGFGHQNFEPITPLVAQRYQVLDLDLRGYGESDRQREGYSMKVWSDDVAALLDHLGIAKAHLHGTSMGSMVAQQFAIDHPDRLRSLILSCGACKMDRAGWLTFEVWIRILERFGLADDTLPMLLAQQGFTRDYLDTPEGADVVPTIRRVSSQACTPEVFIAACRAMQEIDYVPHLPGIAAPTLVLTGELDQMTPIDYGPEGGGSRKIAELIPNAELVLLRGAGHTHLFQQPRETTEAIFAFLERTAGAGRP